MPPRSKEPSEADVVFNRANVALAKSQRLIASWLPPRTEENSKTEEELEKEDQDLFAPVPELLGVGAPLPKDSGDGLMKRKDTSSLDALRKQLLGRHATSKSALSNKDAVASKSVSKTSNSKLLLSESEDEGGRAAAFTSKKKKIKPATMVSSPEEQLEIDNNINEAPDVESANATAPAAAQERHTKRKAPSFLDELLAEKAKKKSKKKKKTAVQS